MKKNEHIKDIDVVNNFFNESDKIDNGKLEIDIKMSIPASKNNFENAMKDLPSSDFEYTLHIDNKFISDNKERVVRTTALYNKYHRHKSFLTHLKKEENITCILAQHTRKPKYNTWHSDNIIEKYFIFASEEDALYVLLKYQKGKKK